MRALWREAPARPAGSVSGAGEGHAVYEAVARLDVPLRDAVVAVDVAELSYAEAARVLRTTRTQVASRVFRARQQLAERGQELR